MFRNYKKSKTNQYDVVEKLFAAVSGWPVY
jgi:hypothetical protein